MSLKSFATQFVELCNQGKNFDIMRMMYAQRRFDRRRWPGNGWPDAGHAEIETLGVTPKHRPIPSFN